MPGFKSTIYKIGINPVVDPPERVLKPIFAVAGRSSGPIPVRGKINGSEFLQTLVKYRGLWRLYVNGPMLKSSGSKVGDKVTVEIEFDPKPREVAVPGQFADVLREDSVARSAFEKLSPSRQKEILKYLGSLKTDVSMKRNIERVIRHLRRGNRCTVRAYAAEARRKMIGMRCE